MKLLCEACRRTLLAGWRLSDCEAPLRVMLLFHPRHLRPSHTLVSHLVSLLCSLSQRSPRSVFKLAAGVIGPRETGFRLSFAASTQQMKGLSLGLASSRATIPDSSPPESLDLFSPIPQIAMPLSSHQRHSHYQHWPWLIWIGWLDISLVIFFTVIMLFHYFAFRGLDWDSQWLLFKLRARGGFDFMAEAFDTSCMEPVRAALFSRTQMAGQGFLFANLLELGSVRCVQLFLPFLSFTDFAKQSREQGAPEARGLVVSKYHCKQSETHIKSLTCACWTLSVCYELVYFSMLLVKPVIGIIIVGSIEKLRFPKLFETSSSRGQSITVKKV